MYAALVLVARVRCWYPDRDWQIFDQTDGCMVLASTGNTHRSQFIWSQRGQCAGGEGKENLHFSH